MCDAATALLVSGVTGAVASLGSLGTAVYSAYNQYETQQGLHEASEANAALQRSQVEQKLQRAAEATSVENYKAAREAVATRGAIRAVDLSDRPTSSLMRAVTFDQSLNEAIRERNTKIAAEDAGAQLRGISITRVSEKLSIGGSKAELISGIGGAVLNTGAQATSLYSDYTRLKDE